MRREQQILDGGVALSGSARERVANTGRSERRAVLSKNKGCREQPATTEIICIYHTEFLRGLASYYYYYYCLLLLLLLFIIIIITVYYYYYYCLLLVFIIISIIISIIIIIIIIICYHYYQALMCFFELGKDVTC